MDPRAYQDSAAGTPPALPSPLLLGYPTSATVPGAYWFHMVGEEVRNAIIRGGIAPDAYATNQLVKAIAAIKAAPHIPF